MNEIVRENGIQRNVVSRGNGCIGFTNYKLLSVLIKLMGNFSNYIKL